MNRFATLVITIVLSLSFLVAGVPDKSVGTKTSTTIVNGKTVQKMETIAEPNPLPPAENVLEEEKALPTPNSGLYNSSVRWQTDAHIRGSRLYASAGDMHQVDIVDISNKRTPLLITRIQYQGAYTHSCWTTDDHKFLFVTDEQDGYVARIWNIERLDSIYEVSRYTANLQSLVHNSYIRGRYAFIAHNTEGMRVVDIADPSVPVEVGYYDTFPGPSGGFNGLWSACPYLPSGKILGGDRTGGLYIWKFNNTQAGRIYGTVSDSLTGLPIDSVLITIAETGRATRSNTSGAFTIGELPGSYTLSCTAYGYVNMVFSNFIITGGDSLTFNVLMPPVIVGIEQSGGQPCEFTLSQNYPNPFNPETKIGFRVSGSGWVSLKVFDVLGREVASLVKEKKEAGTHMVTFDASKLTSGVYFYRLSAGGFVETRKLLLLK